MAAGVNRPEWAIDYARPGWGRGQQAVTGRDDQRDGEQGGGDQDDGGAGGDPPLEGDGQADDAAGGAEGGRQGHGGAQALGPEAGGGGRGDDQATARAVPTAGIEVTTVASTTSSRPTSRASTG